MEAKYMLNDMINEVVAIKKEYVTELRYYEKSETFFKKFKKEKAVLRAKIETLKEFENRLRMELRRCENMKEIEL